MFSLFEVFNVFAAAFCVSVPVSVSISFEDAVVDAERTDRRREKFAYGEFHFLE